MYLGMTILSRVKKTFELDYSYLVGGWTDPFEKYQSKWIKKINAEWDWNIYQKNVPWIFL